MYTEEGIVKAVLMLTRENIDIPRKYIEISTEFYYRLSF